MDNLKALLFDLDNTILDRSQTFLSFTNKFTDRYFSGLADLEKRIIIEQIILLDEDGYKEKRQLFIELLEILEWNDRPLVEELLDYYTSEYVDSAVLMEGALEVLQYYQTKYKIGLITNGKTNIQYGKIDKLELRGYLDTILVSEEVGVKKPNPAIFEMALSNLGLRPEECIYIGDHPVNDIEGAGKAGLQTIWIQVNQPWRDELTVEPIKRITKLHELFEILGKD